MDKTIRKTKRFTAGMLCLGLMCCIFAGKVKAQESFPTSNAVWVERIEWNGVGWIKPDYMQNKYRTQTVRYGIIEDTTINDTVFSKLYEIKYDTMFVNENIQNYTFLGWIKQKDQKVWFNDGLLYDFGVSVGDTVWINIVLEDARSDYLPHSYFDSKCCVIEHIGYENGVKKIYTDNDVWIEGMGSPAGIFGNQMEMCTCFEWYDFSLGCFKHNNIVKYVNNACYSCFDCPTFYPLNYYGVNIIVNSVPDWNFHTTKSYDFAYQKTPLQISLDTWTPPMGYAECGLKPYSYRWTTNSETYIIEDSTISNPAFSFFGDVSVYLKVTDKLGSVAYDTVNLIMGAENVGKFGISEQISIFPNPAKKQLIVKIAGRFPNDAQEVEIYSVVGQCVMQLPCRDVINHVSTIDISHLASGMYFLKMGNKVTKFVKE